MNLIQVSKLRIDSANVFDHMIEHDDVKTGIVKWQLRTRALPEFIPFKQNPYINHIHC